jgi:AcrR family transcriptional regulator
MTEQTVEPRTGTEERIIEAAVQLFSRRGFRGSSTRAIAQLAGVNEVTIFRHFPRKHTLFWAATQSRLQRFKIGPDLMAHMAADDSPQTVLPLIMEWMAEKLCFQSELTRLLYLALFELQREDRQIVYGHLVPLLQPIVEYLARCRGRDQVRSVDPNLATLGLLSSVLMQHAAQMFPNHPQVSDTREIAGACSEFWLRLLVTG